MIGDLLVAISRCSGSFLDSKSSQEDTEYILVCRPCKV